MTWSSVERAASVAPRRHGELQAHDMRVSVWEGDVDVLAMRRVLLSVVSLLRERGFLMRPNPGMAGLGDVSSDYWLGQRGDLLVDAETGGRMVAVAFASDERSEDPSEISSSRFSRLRGETRLRCAVEMGRVVSLFRRIGYAPSGYALVASLASTPSVSLALMRNATWSPSDPLEGFNERWGGTRFRRDASGWPTPEEIGPRNSVDRDGNTLHCGDVRYVRLRGRLLRGTVYTNMNGRWSVWNAGSCLGHVSASDLFSCARPDLEPPRLIRGQAVRLHHELEKSVAAKRYHRAETIARALRLLEAS